MVEQDTISIFMYEAVWHNENQNGKYVYVSPYFLRFPLVTNKLKCLFGN